MSWSALTFDHDRIQGHAFTSFVDRDSEVYDQTLVTTQMKSTAKLNIRHQMAARMASTIVQATSITAFFDDLAADTDLSAFVLDLWAIEVLKLHYRQERFIEGDWLDRMLEEMDAACDTILKALSEMTGPILGLTDTVTSSSVVVVGSVTTDLWDLDTSTTE